MRRPKSSAGKATAIVAVVCAAWLLAAGLVAVPRHAEAARGQGLNLGIGVSSLYDDNILQYSDAQRSLFDSGTKPDRFSIESSDDLVWDPYLSLGWSNQMGHGRSRSLRLRGSGEFHQKNGTADFRSFSAAWRESFSRDSRLTVYAYRLPHFYLRQLFDEDTVPPFPGLSRYRRAEFGLSIGSASWRQRISGKTRAEISYRYEHRGYNRDFVERSSNTHQGELGIEWFRLPNRGAVDLYGGYRKSKAKGDDGDEPAGATPDDPDVSYHGIVAGFRGGMEFARGAGWRLGADLGYELGTRAYESGLPTDKYHFKRNDTSHMIDATLRLSFRPHWSVRGLYHFDHNTANLGTTAPPSADTGSFTENQVGLAVDWSGALWRQSREAVDTEGE